MDCPKLHDGIALSTGKKGSITDTRLSAMPAASLERIYTGTNVRTELRRGCSPRRIKVARKLSVIAAKATSLRGAKSRMCVLSTCLNRGKARSRSASPVAISS